jgi:hypothetical protein
MQDASKNLHARRIQKCALEISPNRIIVCPICFAQKCVIALYVGGLKGALSHHYLGSKNSKTEASTWVLPFCVKDQKKWFIALKTLNFGIHYTPTTN